MLNPRNVFITMLAVSDIFLCIFSIPLTAMDVLAKFWPFGPEMGILCKLIGTIQTSCVFYASFSILLVAVDRFRFIVHPTKAQLSNQMAVLASLIALTLSGLLAIPVFVVTDLKTRRNVISGEYISYCYEVRDGFIHESTKPHF